MKKTKRASRGNGSFRNMSPNPALQPVEPQAAPVRIGGAASAPIDKLTLDEKELEPLRQIDKGMAQARMMLANATLAMLDMAHRVQQVDEAFRNQVIESAKSRGLDMEQNWSFNLQTGTYSLVPAAPTQTQQ